MKRKQQESTQTVRFSKYIDIKEKQSPSQKNKRKLTAQKNLTVNISQSRVSGNLGLTSSTVVKELGTCGEF